MIFVIPSPLMGREVVSHAGSTACLIPLQYFPSAVYPALHEHVYEPKVFWHTELTSQEWEPVVHSSKSKKRSALLFLSFRWKISAERQRNVFPDKMVECKFDSQYFSKSICDTVFGVLRPFFGIWTLFF